MNSYTRSHAQDSGFGLQMCGLRPCLASPKKQPKSSALRSLQIALLGPLLILCGCGSPQTSTTLSIVPRAEAQSSELQAFSSQGLDANTFQPNGVTIWIKWDVFVDGDRWLALGSAGQYNGDTNVGVPSLTRFSLPMPVLPSEAYTMDTFKLGAKENPTGSASLLMVSTVPGFGQPTVSVRPEDGALHIDRLTYPHNGRPSPFVWVQNSWDRPQVMTFVLAGEVRP